MSPGPAVLVTVFFLAQSLSCLRSNRDKQAVAGQADRSYQDSVSLSFPYPNPYLTGETEVQLCLSQERVGFIPNPAVALRGRLRSYHCGQVLIITEYPIVQSLIPRTVWELLRHRPSSLGQCSLWLLALGTRGTRFAYCLGMSYDHMGTQKWNEVPSHSTSPEGCSEGLQSLPTLSNH